MMSKITPHHLQCQAYVYLRQSSPGQVENHRESTERQYALADRAVELGSRPQPGADSGSGPGQKWHNVRGS